eukprot:TRINITY_DN2929_c0_g1_i1.p1 TRINITY_DN2929_c0_g1~~TRINITY_DN2929_c0_g1_i1.p1  ORF type:complete len:269 (+),score=95.29 TRINITY_DN2929_c0_g1_i1:51-857(+)
MRRSMLTSAVRGLRQARWNTAPAWVKPQFLQIYETDFANAEYPERAVGGDYVNFSKLMFQLATAEKKEDKYLSDVQGLLSKGNRLATFWRTESNVATDKEFDNLEPGVRFVLRWMQSCSAMDNLEEVAKIFGIYIKAAKKTIVVDVTLAGLPTSQAKNVEAAKQAAEATLASHFPEKKGWKLEFNYLVDPGIIDGWRLEIGSMVVEDMRVYLDAWNKAASAAASVDYTHGPTIKSLPTVWPQNAETDMLADWCDDLAAFDAEEALHGF